MSEELESCPVCGALPIDQVDTDAVRELVSNRYKFSHQALLDDCAAREAAKRIVDWADNGKLADDEWLVERNETAIIAICRALLSSPRVEEVRREERERIAKALARANDRLPGIEVPAAEGDNLAVVLCSFFCDGEPSEDDHGWSPAAIKGEEQMIEAIRKHYTDALSLQVG